MSTEDEYSTKDSNRNRRIEERQSTITHVIAIVCTVLIVIFCLFYFSSHYWLHGTPKQPEPPAIVSDQAHPYDSSRPPEKQ
jgi:amino acid transporter